MKQVCRLIQSKSKLILPAFVDSMSSDSSSPSHLCGSAVFTGSQQQLSSRWERLYKPSFPSDVP